MRTTQMAISGLRVLVQATRIRMLGLLNLLRKALDTATDSTAAPASEPTADDVPTSSPNLDSTLPAATVSKKLGQHNGNGKSVEVYLHKVLAGLPLDLQPRIRRRNIGEQTICVPVEKILAQLSQGAVKISFGELRQAAPGVFTDEEDQDWVMVELPLADILTQVDVASIRRHRIQRRV